MPTSIHHLSMNFTRKLRLLPIVALTAAAICIGQIGQVGLFQLTGTASAASAGNVALRGQAAIERLKRDGGYESLRTALEAAQPQALDPALAHQAKLTAAAAAASDFFGAAVAVSGDTAAIGAFFADG